jgi:hypothetical protein
MTRFSAFALVIGLASVGAASLMAQPGGRRGGPPGGPGDFALLGGQFGFAGKVVTGAPYSAQAVTQVTQTLADGTHIQHSSSATLARDSQGRTRVERSMSSIGRLAGSGAAARTIISIHDPVASMSYELDAATHTARQMQVATNGGRRGPGPGAAPAGAPRPGGPMAQGAGRNNTDVTSEDLGTQVVSGVNAQGTRVTRTIPAGTEGNDKAMSIVRETWYSSDLQMVVMSKTTDPRFGETSYTLSNISRVEPDPALFSVPSGYTVQQGRPHPPAVTQ